MESQHGTELVQGAIYEFHKPAPGRRMHVEIVFMHGLQVKAADVKDAYYKTWRTSDNSKTEVWPKTWLKQKYPNARILSLAYDSSARKTKAAGNMSPYSLGECLLAQMVSTKGNIGQNDCPVVFVGHSLGGLIAKEIVVRCCNSDSANPKYQNLLRNIKAVFFYATPHGGSDLAGSKIVQWFPFVNTSLLVEYLKPNNTDRTHTQHNFLRAVQENDCKFYVVAEGRPSNIYAGVSKWIVHENSASFPGLHDFVTHKDADHMTVCKPQGKNDTGYLMLINCIDKVIQEYRGRVEVDLSVDHPIGIEGKIDEISKLLEKPEVSIVGLFGMGGGGKTTLSKSFYNRKACKYVKSCYLENVKSKGVQVVQRELLRGLCGEQLNQDKGVEKQHLDMIRGCFRKYKVLVVVDDVSSEECLGKLQVFYDLKTRSQSKVVVTGRDSAILPKKYLNSGKARIVPVNGIKDSKDSDLKLFLRYAFDGVPKHAQNEVRIKLLDAAKWIVQLCNGLPLSLEVLGKYLGNSGPGSEYKDLQKWKETWDDAFKRLQTAQNINGNKIWSSLRRSYDHLGNIEKEMFLDFACIFSHLKVEKRVVEQIWNSSGGVENLVNKSLLKEEGGYFVMHDQLRDMGRHILLEEALKDYEGPIYFWKANKDSSKTYAEFRKKTTKSDVPYIASGKNEVGKNLRKYSKLRLMVVIGCQNSTLMDDCLSQCSGDLKFLHLKNCLGVLKIGLKKLCSFEGLRVLHIFNCGEIEDLPWDIGKLMSLVEIEVWDCCNLLSLPDTISKLKNLKRLVIARCQGLRAIPESVKELSNVEYLSLENCDKLKMIYGTHICTQKLKTLKLPIMPKNCLRPCPQLQRLNIKNGRGVKEFTPDFFKIDMPKLEVVEWRNYYSIEVVLKNPNGSKLVLKNGGGGFRYSIERRRDGSISRLLENFPTKGRPLIT